MLIKLLCLLSIFSFLSASNVEVGSLVMDSDLSVSAQIDKDLSASEVEKEHCNDCRGDGCSDSEDCCKSLCSCSSNYFVSDVYEVSELNSRPLSKSRWFFFSHYQLPFLDPALKPPLFS